MQNMTTFTRSVKVVSGKLLRKQSELSGPFPDAGRRYSRQVVQTREASLPAMNLTTWLADHISDFSIANISTVAQRRSKRMILDIIGVGMIGSKTEIADSYRQFGSTVEGFHSNHKASIWGTGGLKASMAMAAYLNGASCHAMDFDDTWHPATHPSGPVLPALMALSDVLPRSQQPSLEEVLVAFNIGIQVQGALLNCSTQARNIPHRLHPPAIVGVMGSAAACSRLLGHDPQKCRHALAIAASFAGAPMANAGTTTKPLHAGKSARFGLEAAILADKGIKGNDNILDMPSGFGAFYEDYNPKRLLDILTETDDVILHHQDIALKRFPCHLGMHWAIDAAMGTREQLVRDRGGLSVDYIKDIYIIAPGSKYINRPIPTTEHEARHSFQFTTCSALLDGEVTPETFHVNNIGRQPLLNLLQLVRVITPDNNAPSFDDMYVTVGVTTNDNATFESTCTEPYGHWRKPLSDNDVIKKFRNNTRFLSIESQNRLVSLVSKMSKNQAATEISQLLH
ncbi:cis-aconitate decarboxylase-like isoform X2 [Mizuhopecten yessoensis]|uniref:Cis-aconitate decarboxylase n=1 Tax=Mizuhopecten yessoensis TaxID=6573 RepID=A0A210QF94_MIZYE|nr:cis-aconitate decarboxylase-like isoform X2 [Mizuhopecten yessoensis]OWF47416.1 Cis-aconitate decarboxylase [Mizuhopecten yessoensis]